MDRPNPTHILRLPGLPLAVAAAVFVLAGCSSNDPTPTSPNTEPAPARLFQIVGTPYVSTRITAALREATSDDPPTGTVEVTFTDELGRSVYLPDVRMNDLPMALQPDTLTSPKRYDLDVDQVPGWTVDDTLYIAVVDGGTVTPPFEFRIYPSHITNLPADSTHVSTAQDLVFRWTGQVERMFVNIADVDGNRVRSNLQFQNYTGQNVMTMPGRDLAPLRPGLLQFAADCLDDELYFTEDPVRRQTISFRVSQNRAWFLDP